MTAIYVPVIFGSRQRTHGEIGIAEWNSVLRIVVKSQTCCQQLLCYAFSKALSNLLSERNIYMYCVHDKHVYVLHRTRAERA